MKSKKEFISANEINKFIYCPYQWYYEKQYGIAHLRKLYRERNQRLGLTGNIDHNFVKGQKFHNSYYMKDKLFKLLKIVLFVVAFIAGIVAGTLYYAYSKGYLSL